MTTLIRAALSVNQELVLLYWTIGRDLSARMATAEWGSKTVSRLSKDLENEFPDSKSFSARNLMFMRSFSEAWPDEKIVKQLVSQFPWGHNLRLLGAVKEPEERKWYIQQTIKNGWSRRLLVHQIDSGLYRRQGQALTNFEAALPAQQSDLANQILKDPYNFGFLTIAPDAHEKELHMRSARLVHHDSIYSLRLNISRIFNTFIFSFLARSTSDATSFGAYADPKFPTPGIKALMNGTGCSD